MSTSIEAQVQVFHGTRAPKRPPRLGGWSGGPA